MKFHVFFFLLISNVCLGQQWMAEVMVGASGYNGDLTKKEVSLKRLRPVVNFNLKYNSGDFINIRAGIGFGMVTADDKDNKNSDVQVRNLNFKSHILELSVCAELNLLDPEIYVQYPYVFAGLGLFHFNPYSYDVNNKKTYLQPLSTEGEGLSEYPDRKRYSRIQFCVPLGLGFKITKKNWEICYEFGYRLLFTDYLDDVSKTYVSLEILNVKKGPKAVEMAYRKVGIPFQEEGYTRGNPGINDYYFFSGLKFAFNLEMNKKDSTPKIF